MPQSLWGCDMKRFSVFVFCLLAMTCFSLSADAISMPEGFTEVIDTLPDDVMDKLPEGVFSEEGDGGAESLLQMLDGENIFTVLLDMVKDELFSSHSELREFARVRYAAYHAASGGSGSAHFHQNIHVATG